LRLAPVIDLDDFDQAPGYWRNSIYLHRCARPGHGLSVDLPLPLTDVLGASTSLRRPNSSRSIPCSAHSRCPTPRAACSTGRIPEGLRIDESMHPSGLPCLALWAMLPSERRAAASDPAWKYGVKISIPSPHSVSQNGSRKRPESVGTTGCTVSTRTSIPPVDHPALDPWRMSVGWAVVQALDARFQTGYPEVSSLSRPWT